MRLKNLDSTLNSNNFGKTHLICRIFDSGSAVLRETFTPLPPTPPKKIDLKYIFMCKVHSALSS